MTEVTTDCRSFDGVTVGLIDSIITSARVLSHRDKTSIAVREALADLREDEDVKNLMGILVEVELPKSATLTFPINHTNPKIPGVVIQYDLNVFIWHTLEDERTHRAPEMRVANSLKKAWAHLGSHLRIRGKL